jgi:ornithine cyclodeaminase/alanine dehydrogenase-like protein (mu-crystallin family)
LKYFDQTEIEDALSYPELITKLEDAFKCEYSVPLRNHYNYKSGEGEIDSTLLLMPALKNEKYVGLKIITVSPYNAAKDMATIQGIYVLMDARNGKVIAQFDAKSLTNLRTAAASALASKFLSRKNSSSLLMMGTGALAPELIKAHCAVRPIESVFVWGRNYQKACNLAQSLFIEKVEIVPIEDVEEYIPKVDIISTATSSPDPLVFGDRLIPGQHIDLVGAFKPTWREADDEAILNSSVFVDTREGTLSESGELLIPMEKGLFKKEDIKADLFDLCKKQKSGRNSQDEITSFISVGYALEDLAAAELVWEKFVN